MTVDLVAELKKVVEDSVAGVAFPGLKVCGICGRGVDAHVDGLYPHVRGCIVERLAKIVRAAEGR